MSKLVRYSADELRNIDVSEELRRLAEMPDSEIRTDLIPERRFNVPLAIERRKAGWKPAAAAHKKAS
jgi:hypothetical protein